jgi:hypothetical protein
MEKIRIRTSNTSNTEVFRNNEICHSPRLAYLTNHLGVTCQENNDVQSNMPRFGMATLIVIPGEQGKMIH